MDKPKFTKMQQAAVDIRNKNVLVSAAAGSGKTAVLVNRIIERVLDENNPVDIDRILVMTFTRAAAAQMKERILDAINAKRKENPHDENLNRQYMLVHNAYIMTIDSFCMNVVKSHFEEIELSPDFRMADEAEITLIKKDVLSEILEERYESGDVGFLRMTEAFATKKTDAAIEDLVLSLYRYAESYPDPSEWLETCRKNSCNVLEPETNEPIEEKYPWINIYLNYVRTELTHLRNALNDAGDICTRVLGPAGYLNAIEDDIKRVDRILSYNDYSDLYNRCCEDDALTFSRLGNVSIPKAGKAPIEEIEERTRLKERTKAIRDKSKKTYSDIVSLIATMSPDTINQGMETMSGPTSELVELTELFDERFNERKRELNVVDFSDIEHMCLKILIKGKDTTARQYEEFFEEIYVDEYQDSNFVQEEILRLISKKSENTGNVFMVGDVKQSIYGFRNAKPEIFVSKYDTYKSFSENGDNDSRDICIDLSHNFRSRPEVLRSVNNVFSKIMTKRLGGIEYDEKASLHLGREFIDTGCDYNTELELFISDEDTSDKEAEAMVVAAKIMQLMKSMKVEDKDAPDGMRPLKYSDIVILLRATKGLDNIFAKTLENQGIPVFVTSTTGYFEADEVKTVLNYLKIIDNPLQDIPLAAVMMSPMGNFYEEDVARIRGEFKDGYLYEALQSYRKAHCAGDDGNSILNRKVSLFSRKIDYYRNKSEYRAVSDIITEIIDGEYGKIVKAMPGGKKKFANLNMLLKKAIEYGKTSYKGIFQFNRYIETIRKYEIDFGEANLSDESDDTVRIMSIHKSKGLEFPVCIVAGFSKKMNMMDTRASVLTDGEYGIATDIIDIDRRVKSKSLFKIAVARKKRTEIIAEELRLLYVAMTRAKEKLILTGVVKDKNTITDSFVTLENASSYLDMYIAATENGSVEGIDRWYWTTESIIDNRVEKAMRNEARRRELITLINADADSVDVDEEIKKRLEFVYPYEDKGYVKIGVSQLKHFSEKNPATENTEFNDATAYLFEDEERTEDAEFVDTIAYQHEGNGTVDKSTENPADAVKDKRRGPLHGTAVHRILEIWDYDREVSIESVKEFLAYVENEMLMEGELFGLVSEKEIYNFLISDIGKRMGAAYKRGELFREQPFVMCDDENDPESMLVQGVIDAFFIEDDEIVLVDYKTNNVRTDEALKEKYTFQLEYYAKALKRLIHKNVKESVIYSTVLKRCISI